MYQLKYNQKLPIGLEEAWDFFSKPKNLSVITPDYLRFEMTTESQGSIYPGQIIAYRIRPILNIPIEWVTEITHVKELNYFIDEQLVGPYRLWHHEHWFKSTPHGVEMNDIITYKMPFGPFGKLLNDVKVKKDLASIFAYRREKLRELFGD